MKILATVLLFVVAGCGPRVVVGSAPPAVPANAPGAATARDAVRLFMASVKDQDLQAMSNIWGSTEGPVRRTMEPKELEQREIILMCFTKHDSYQMLGEAPAKGGERVLAVELKFKDVTRSTNFYTTRGPSDRWYVRQFDMDPLRDICATK